MKKLFMVIGLVALAGCEKWDQTSGGTMYRIDVIDGCEYVRAAGEPLIHKGNCTNLIHKNLSAEAR